MDFFLPSAFVLPGSSKEELVAFVATTRETMSIFFASLKAPDRLDHLHDPIVEALHCIGQSGPRPRQPQIPVALVIEFFRGALPSVSVDHLEPSKLRERRPCHHQLSFPPPTLPASPVPVSLLFQNGESSKPAPQLQIIEVNQAGAQCFLPSRTVVATQPCAKKKKKHPTDTLSLFLQQQATSIRSIKSLVPLLDRVLVQRIKAEAKTASGIFLPESSVKELNEAKVLAVGPGGIDREGKRVPMGVQAGDRVLIPTVSLSWWRTRLSAREKKKYPPRG